MRIFTAALFMIFGFWSCEDSETKELYIQNMIEEDVNQRIQRFVQVREEVCQEQVIERAIELADSLLLEEVRSYKIKTMVPTVPLKPDRPNIDTKEAYEKVRPILDSIQKRNDLDSIQSVKK